MFESLQSRPGIESESPWLNCRLILLYSAGIHATLNKLYSNEKYVSIAQFEEADVCLLVQLFLHSLIIPSIDALIHSGLRRASQRNVIASMTLNHLLLY